MLFVPFMSLSSITSSPKNSISSRQIMMKLEEKKRVAIGLIGLGIVFSILAAVTNCSAGGADNFAHFNIARWAFRYPYLFLDHWGKPVFTIFIAPFVQFGFYGARIFNIIAGLCTAWICYLLADHWKLRKAWLMPGFVIFAPLYFLLMFTGMTEILFSLILMLSILLFFRQRYILSAIVISFIILVRSEGFVFFSILMLAFAMKRKFKAIPFLFAGFLFFSLIGKLYYYHDFWWLIHKLPYGTNSGEIYGSGTWYHFLADMPDYLSYIMILLFFTGIIVWLKDWSTSRFSIAEERFYQLFILCGIFFGYLAAHSFMWWRGEMSLGLVRVMPGVTPIAGILALAGYNYLEDRIKSEKWKKVFLAGIALLIVIPGTLKYRAEFRTDEPSKVMTKAISWLRETNNFRHHLVVHDPSIAFLAQVDPWDQRVIQFSFSDVKAPEKDMPDSSIVIWDAHFSPNEGRMPAERLLDHPNFELLSYFQPKIPFKVLGGYDYCVMIFIKVSSRTSDNHKLFNSLKEKSANGQLVYMGSFDFERENPEKVRENFRMASTDSITNHFYQMDAESDFSPCVLMTDKQLKINNKLNFEVSFDMLPGEKLEKGEVMMVFSVEENDKSYSYQAEDILPFLTKSDKWNTAQFHFVMPQDLKKNSQIKFYIWDIRKKKLKIDNFCVKAFVAKED